MRLHEHLIASTVLGALLYRRDWRRVALTALAGVALDVDHITLYAARSGDWSITGAMRYNRWRHGAPKPGDNRPRFGSLRSVLHRPLLTLTLLWLPARYVPWLRPIAAGVTLHLAMDVPRLNLDWRVWRRARGRCEGCGVVGLERNVYYRIATRHGGHPTHSNNRLVLCRACMIALHQRHNQEDGRSITRSSSSQN